MVYRLEAEFRTKFNKYLDSNKIPRSFNLKQLDKLVEKIQKHMGLIKSD
jgi:hypothetical protein